MQDHQHRHSNHHHHHHLQMETIFHEKQEGQLCAQHALNTLLQGQYFTPVDLGEIAAQLDREERASLDQDPVHFLQEGKSHNMDDSGFFSVQVMARALKVWQLDMIPFNRRDCPVATAARSDPTSQSGFICNQSQHWFTIRRIGHQWFNLNSLLSGPELVSDTYLSLFLTQLQHEGFTIFIVSGSLPESEADRVLSMTRVTQAKKQPLLSMKGTTGKLKNVDPGDLMLLESVSGIGADGFTDEERNTFRSTIESSRQHRDLEEQRQMQLALAASLDFTSTGAQEQPTEQEKQQVMQPHEYMTEQEMLEAAVRMSLQPETGE